VGNATRPALLSSSPSPFPIGWWSVKPFPEWMWVRKHRNAACLQYVMVQEPPLVLRCQYNILHMLLYCKQ